LQSACRYFDECAHRPLNFIMVSDH
jgi:hypothetical protein